MWIFKFLGEVNLRILIVIPAYNEQENIERVVDQLMENYPPV